MKHLLTGQQKAALGSQICWAHGLLGALMELGLCSVGRGKGLQLESREAGWQSLGGE